MASYPLGAEGRPETKGRGVIGTTPMTFSADPGNAMQRHTVTSNRLGHRSRVVLRGAWELRPPRAPRVAVARSRSMRNFRISLGAEFGAVGI